MKGWLSVATGIVGSAVILTACQSPPFVEPFGERLYVDNCLSCHNTETAWRDKRRASDWVNLKAEVRRWQGNVGLNWRDYEIDAVAKYLNRRFYDYPIPDGG